MQLNLLGPTRQLHTSMWKSYLRIIEYCTSRSTAVSSNIHSLSHVHLCFTDARHMIQRPSRVYLALATGQRTSQQMYRASSKTSYNEHGSCCWSAICHPVCQFSSSRLPIQSKLPMLPSIPKMPTCRTTPATQPTRCSSAWRGGDITRTYPATAHKHVEILPSYHRILYWSVYCC